MLATSRDTILAWTGALLDGCSAGRDSAVDRMGGHYTAILLLNQRAELTLKND